MKITMGEMYRRYEKGERDFTGLSLPNADFRFTGIPREIILKKANLNGAILEEMMIPPIDMSYAKFKKARLGETAFCGTNLEGADFRGALFCQTSFGKCNLRHANFSKTVLEEILFVITVISLERFEKKSSPVNSSIWLTVSCHVCQFFQVALFGISGRFNPIKY